MLRDSEIEGIKRQIKEELRVEFREMISREITGGCGRVLKKVLRILSLNLGVDLKLPKDSP